MITAAPQARDALARLHPDILQSDRNAISKEVNPMTMRSIARAPWYQGAKLARSLIDKSTLGSKYLQMDAIPASPHCYS
eukprot:4903552-Pyramimonas_sp.AAC.1